jgi:predicted nuclease of restriction endonuclease-like (RecB) superfamily
VSICIEDTIEEGKMSKSVIGQEYVKFLAHVKERIRQAQYTALRSANKELVTLYWDIGKSIVGKQKALGWGRSVVERLAEDLHKEFPGVQGFSARNIWYMREFYELYSKRPKLQPMVAEISWTKHLLIMPRCKTDNERMFYIEMTRRFGWTKNVLAHQLDTNAYKRYRDNQTSFDKTLPEKIKAQAKLAVKDEYTFDFLELGEEHAEHQLEHALMREMRRFLMEMGGYFCFVADQYRLDVDGSEFFIDLLLYHRGLRCLVAIELKVGDFKPEFAGKMQFYLSALNARVRLEGENPPIGIIICRNKNRTVVEYALSDVKKPIGVATYVLKEELPRKLAKYLPSQKDFVMGLKAMGGKGEGYPYLLSI